MYHQFTVFTAVLVRIGLIRFIIVKVVTTLLCTYIYLYRIYIFIKNI